MNWEIAGALGEIIGGCAVIITIGFLAIQMRQANILGKAEAERDWFSIQQVLVRELAGSEDSARSFRAGLNFYSELSSTEQAVFSMKLINFFDHVDVLRRLYEKGFVSEDLMNQLLSNLSAIINTPGGNDWWEQHKPILSIASYLEANRDRDALPFTEVLPYFFQAENERDQTHFTN